MPHITMIVIKKSISCAVCSDGKRSFAFETRSERMKFNHNVDVLLYAVEYFFMRKKNKDIEMNVGKANGVRTRESASTPSLG